MIFRLSQNTERIVGALDAGEELVDSLMRVCRDNGVISGELRALGAFDSVELVRFDAASRSYRTVIDAEGDFSLLSLTGNIARLGDETVLRIDALFQVMGPLGPQIVGGQLRRARAVQAEFVVESFPDLLLERRLDPKSGRLILDKVERTAPMQKAGRPAIDTLPDTPPPPAPADDQAPTNDPAPAAEPAQSTMSWAEAVAETDRVDKARSASRRGMPPKKAKDAKTLYDDLDFDEPLMKPGDVLDHPKLGKCRVMKVEDDTYAHIRLPRGRIRKLAMEVLQITYEGEEDGARVFKARIRR